MEITCHAYDTEFMQDESEGLHLWCLDKDSIPIHILVKGTPIYMYIELPETPSISRWDNDAVDMLFDNFKKVHGRCAPFMMDYTERQKLYYYRGEYKTPMARVFFKSPKDMNICTWRLKKTQDYPDFGNLNFRIFEKDINVRRKVFTIRKTRFCQWFTVDKYREINFGSRERMATQGVPGREIREIIIDDYTNIKPVPVEDSRTWASRPRVLSYDIETYSDNHHSLPDKTNPDHVIYMISCVYQETGDKSTRERYVIMTEDCEKIPGSNIIKAKDEEDLIILFLDLIKMLDPEIMMGYNIFGYDNPYIDAKFSMSRECYEPVSRLQGHIPEMSNMAWASGAYGTTIISHLRMPGRITIDLYPIIKRDYKFDKYTLDFVSGELLGSSKHDVTALQMFKAYESKDIKEMTRVTKYCIQDSDLVLDLYEKMNVWIGLVEMANIVGVEIMELFTRGQQIRCVSQIYNMTHMMKIILNSRDTVEMEYKGGQVEAPIVGLHEYVLSVDFSSLYPSIMRAYNICYTTLIPKIFEDDYDDDEVNIIDVGDGVKYKFIKAHIRKGVLPQLVENLVNERNAVRGEMKVLDKKLKNLEKDPMDNEEAIKQLRLTLVVLEKRQLGLKVSANSMYGFLGVQTGGKLPLIEAAICITSMGRQLITRVNEALKDEFDATIVYGDTDSSMVSIPAVKHASEANEWGHKLAAFISGTPEEYDAEGNVTKDEVPGMFPPPLKMEFENAMRFLAIAKKKYAAFLIDEDGEFKLEKDGTEKIYKRGIAIARRDNFPYLRVKYTEILRAILQKQPIEYTFKLILDSVQTILSGTLPAKGNLTIIRGLGKEYKSNTYFMKVFQDELARMGHPVASGDRLEYVIVKTEPGTPLGRSLRLLEMYEDSLLYDEKTDGPRPDTLYPVEEIDYMRYVTNGIANPFDQLFCSGYMTQLYKTNISTDSVYNPKRAASKPVSVATPIKMMIAMMKDDVSLDGIYEWFIEEVKNAVPIEDAIVPDIEDIFDEDSSEEDDY